MRFDDTNVVNAKELLEKAAGVDYQFCFSCKGLLVKTMFYANTFRCKSCSRLRESKDPHVKLRQITRSLIKNGHIEKTPCVSCGTPVVEAHHLSYNDPTDVEFRCAPCHRSIH